MRHRGFYDSICAEYICSPTGGWHEKRDFRHHCSERKVSLQRPHRNQRPFQLLHEESEYAWIVWQGSTIAWNENDMKSSSPNALQRRNKSNIKWSLTWPKSAWRRAGESSLYPVRLFRHSVWAQKHCRNYTFLALQQSLSNLLLWKHHDNDQSLYRLPVQSCRPSWYEWDDAVASV